MNGPLRLWNEVDLKDLKNKQTNKQKTPLSALCFCFNNFGINLGKHDIFFFFFYYNLF